MAQESYNPERSRREKIMTETGTAEAGTGSQTPVQSPEGETFSPSDTQNAVTEAERILRDIGNQPRAPDVGVLPSGVIAAQGVDIPPQGSTPPGGGMGGDGDRENRGGGGPNGPESNNHPEWLTSPERGRWLVEQILYTETELPYEVRYKAENRPILNELYRKFKEYVEWLQEDRNKEAPLDLKKEHQVETREGESFMDAIRRAYQKRIDRGVKPELEALPTPEDLTGVAPLRVLITSYNNIFSPDEATMNKAVADLPETKAALLKYFRKAKGKELLKGVDEILNSIYLAYKSGEPPPDRIRRYADQEVAGAYSTAESEYLSQIEEDSEIRELFGVWEPYLKIARSRLEREFNGRVWTPEDGEWRPPRGEDAGNKKETYWQPYGGYPDYYVITANNPREFRIAMETFMQMVRNHALGYAPDDLMQNLINFKKVLSGRATRLAEEQEGMDDGPDKMTTGFAEEIRQEFEGRAFLWYTFYQYENYNKENGKSGATTMALHEGPQRWTRTLRSGVEAGVGFHTWNYDYSAVEELAINAQGSRGQLGGYTPAQEEFRRIVHQMQIERGMGVVLKDYDRRDVPIGIDAKLRQLRAQRLEQIEEYLERNRNNFNSLTDEDRDYYINAKAHLRTNRERIGMHQAAEEMKSLYEGFDKGDAHRNNYQEYVIKKGLDVQKLPKKLQASVRLGMIQDSMDKVRESVRYRKTIVLKKGEDLLDKAIDRLVDLGRIGEKEKRLYKKLYTDAYTDSQAAFEITLQMEGATHEGTIRGGGMLFITRNEYVRAYKIFRQEHQKVTKAKDKDISKWTLEERRTQLTKKQHIGWVLDEIAKGTKVDELLPYERQLYDGLTPEQRDNFKDHMPTHLAEEFGMAAVNWVRIQYGDGAKVWEKPEFAKKLKPFLSPDRNFPQGRPNPDYVPNFRARYRAAMVQHAVDDMAVEQISAKGYEAKLFHDEFDAKYLDYFDDKTGKLKNPDNKPTPISTSVMKLKRPHVFGYTQLGQPVIAFGNDGKPIFGYNQDNHPIGLSEGDFDELGQAIFYNKPADIVRNGQVVEQRRRIDLSIRSPYFYQEGYTITERNDGEGRPTSFVFVEEVNLDFPTAVESDLAFHTTHTYWAYQSNNTHTLIPEYVFRQARQVRDGQIRSEDADIFAGLLLTLDPTLRRVKGFPGEQMSLEGIVFDAAVEESFMGSVYVKAAIRQRFLPRDGNAEHMDTGYYKEDQGGDVRFAVHAAASAAKMPKRWARRFSAALGATPMYLDSMARNLGRRGVTGAVSMMCDNINELTGQRIMSQFAITKFVNMVDSSTALWFALVGGTDPKTGVHHEGLFTKPTNNADQLARLREKFPEFRQMPNHENEAFYALLESFGRAWETLKVIRTMYSDNRSAGGALLLDKTDVFLPNGRFNPAIALEKEKNTGSSRHIAERFWDNYVEWLLDEGPGGGAAAYPDVAHIYKVLRDPFFEDRLVKAGEHYTNIEGREMISNIEQTVKARDGRTWANWLFDKMVL
ncbi:MAG: hypothetical protein Q7R77_00325 [Candidatus Daviesbacteria bacterium]|nr:hypothetical protein [Candidatus Daviesbacteria bacterium]